MIALFILACGAALIADACAKGHDRYDAIMQAADRCESCGSPGGTGNARLVLDHHHGKGRFRGVLCSGCNLAAGHAYDDPARLRLLADYIEARA